MKGLAPILGIAIVTHVHRADADTAADIKAVLLAQITAITAGDGAAFAKTIAASDVFAILPGGYASTAAQAGPIVQRAWPKGSNVASLTTLVSGSQGDVAWATASLELKPSNPDFATGTYRATELFVRDGGTWKVHAISISTALQDIPQMWAKGDWAKRDKPPGSNAKNSPLAGLLAHPADLASHLHASPEVVVLGAFTERGEGPDAGKALAAWKDVAFTTAWTRAGGDGKTYVWLAARVSRKVTVNAKPIDEPYWVLVLAIKGTKDWEIVSAHYSQLLP